MYYKRGDFLITLYSGTPGSGKSLHAAEVTYNWLVYAKKNVIANFPVNMQVLKYSRSQRRKAVWKKGYQPKKRKTGHFFYFSDDVISPKLLLKYRAKHHVPKKEKQTLLIFDECSSDDLFNNRTWQNTGRNNWITFFRQHRKLGFEIIFIAQSDKLIDKAMRSFVEYEIKHRKANNYKLLGRILGLLSGGALFFAVEYWYGVREKIGTQMFRYKGEMGAFYDTYKVF